MSENTIAAIKSVVETYFDALYFADPVRMAEVMHGEAIYATATDGNLLFRTMPDYLAVLEQREAPAARGETRRDTIRSIVAAGPGTAFVLANCAIGDRYFTDLLTLMHIGGRWWIMSKIFDAEPLPAA